MLQIVLALSSQLLRRMCRKKNMNPKLVFNNDPFLSVQTSERLTL